MACMFITKPARLLELTHHMLSASHTPLILQIDGNDMFQRVLRPVTSLKNCWPLVSFQKCCFLKVPFLVVSAYLNNAPIHQDTQWNCLGKLCDTACLATGVRKLPGASLCVRRGGVFWAADQLPQEGRGMRQPPWAKCVGPQLCRGRHLPKKFWSMGFPRWLERMKNTVSNLKIQSENWNAEKLHQRTGVGRPCLWF